MCSYIISICELESLDDIALGIFDDYEYKEKSRVITKNETLVLYTDGIPEATSPENELYSLQRFKDLLSDIITLEIKDILVKIGEDLRNFQSGNQFDDITLLLLRRKK